jgi:hypothetical protein
MNVQTNLEQQREIKLALESLVHQRFNKESLEEKLSQIFNEKITIELGCEDVEEFPDWNYMFTSEQPIIGGDFDVYVLMQKNKDMLGNTMYVTEVGYEFTNRYW